MKTFMTLLLAILLPLALVAANGGKSSSSSMSRVERISKEVFSKEHMRAMGDLVHQGNVAFLGGIKTGTHYFTDWSVRIFTFRWLPDMESSYKVMIKCCRFISSGWFLNPVLSI